MRVTAVWELTLGTRSFHVGPSWGNLSKGRVEGGAWAKHQTPYLLPCRTMKVVVASGLLQVSLALRVLCSSKCHSFLPSGSWSPTVWLRGPQYGGLGGQSPGVGTLKTQFRVWVRAFGTAGVIFQH